MADNPQIKKLKIGSTTYDIRDASVGSQISTAITNLNLGSAAYENTSAFDASGAATAAENNAKNYADGLISGLGSIMRFKGVKTSESAITGLTSATLGDVWVNSADGSEWVCKETITAAKASAWEKFGTTDVSGALFKGDNTFTDSYILKADGTNGKVKAVVADGSAVGLGNVTNVAQVGQNSTVTAGHVAVWHADHTIKDGGALGTAAFANTGAFDASGAASSAEQAAKNYADQQMGKLVTASDGAHTHTVSASGTCTPQLSPTPKYLSAAASGGAVSLGGTTTFLTSVGLTTQNLVTGSIAVGGMVTNVEPTRANQSGFTSSYDSETCCLTLTPFSGYIVSDITTTKNTGAITYATGSVSATGSGAAVGTDVTSNNGTVSVGTFTQPTITLTANESTAAGRITYLQSVTGASTSVSVSGSAASNGDHTHTISKSSS